MTPFAQADHDTWTPRGGLKECGEWVAYFQTNPFDLLTEAMGLQDYPPHEMFWLDDARAAHKLWTPRTGVGGWEWLVFYLLRATYFADAAEGAKRKRKLIERVRKLGWEDKQAFVAALVMSAPAEGGPRLPVVSDNAAKAWEALFGLETLVDVMTKRMRKRARKTGT